MIDNRYVWRRMLDQGHAPKKHAAVEEAPFRIGVILPVEEPIDVNTGASH